MALYGLLRRKAMTKTESYRQAYEAYLLAQSNLAAATVAAFPLGADVAREIEHAKRHGVPFIYYRGVG